MWINLRNLPFEIGRSFAGLCLTSWAIVGLVILVTRSSFHLGYLLAGLLGIVALVGLSVAVHELGHLFAALAMKLHVHQVAITPLQLIRVNGAFRLRLYFAGHRGRVAAGPRDTYRVRQRMALFIAGGPLVSLLASVLCFVLASCIEADFPPVLPRTNAGYWLDFAALLNFWW